VPIFEIRQAAVVDFGDASEGADVLGVLLYVAGEDFYGLGEGFVALRDAFQGSLDPV
jgi:hypothetical protein